MASTDSTSISQVFDALVALETSFQRLDSNTARSLVIRDAHETIAALVGERALLLATIDALNIERANLTRWKNEALTVLSAWEKVWQAAGRPGPLGRSLADNTADEITRLRAEIDALIPESPAALDLDECGNNRTTVQAHFDDEIGLWAFYEDPDPETDFAVGQVTATIPASLWQQFAANGAEYDRLNGLMVEAANLDPDEGRRAKPCDAFTRHRIPDPGDPCTTCGWAFDHHEQVGP